MLTLKTYKRRKDSIGSDGKLVHLASVVASDDNLLREFLFRLPVGSLLRFKLVSKHWLSLITDPFFTRNYNLRYPPRCSGILLSISYCSLEPEYVFISLDSTRKSGPCKSLTFISDPFGVRIVDSCNGLFCCRSSNAELIERDYYIYNPTTKKYTILPKTPFQSEEYPVYSLSIAFDPLVSADYKIVCIRGIVMDVYPKFQLMIYSSSTRYWRTLAGVFSARDDVYRSGVYWNGALHWVGRHWHPSLCFDVNEEIFREMPNAPIPAGREGLRVEDYVNTEYVGASREHLYLVHRYDCGSQLNIFELEGDYSGLSRDDPNLQFQWDKYVFYVLHVQGEPGPSLLLGIRNKIISYNLKDETFMEIQELPPRPGLHYPWIAAHKYIETLTRV